MFFKLESSSKFLIFDVGCDEGDFLIDFVAYCTSAFNCAVVGIGIELVEERVKVAETLLKGWGGKLNVSFVVGSFTELTIVLPYLLECSFIYICDVLFKEEDVTKFFMFLCEYIPNFCIVVSSCLIAITII